MDYDDNDILHHNPKLAGEGRSRSSSVLKPYDFPRFDFDDSLQGHLRFDSLVETEDFLGIQSQEDNQWIEDFSRGSNGMEFNPTPADSCSISRGNNVWSEATSSESVEMLLKSVGQEEMIPGETVIQDSKTFGDQGTATKHVKLGSTLDEKDDARIRNSGATLPQEEFLTNHPVSDGLVVEQLREVKDPSQAVVNVESACIGSSNLVDSASNEKGRTSTNEGSISHHDESSNEDVKVLNLSDEKSMTCGSQEDSLCFTKIVDHNNSDLVVLSDSKISPQVIAFDSCNSDKQEKDISAGRGEDDSKISEQKTDDASIHMCRASSSLCLVAESGVVSRQDAVDGSLNYVRENQEDGRNGLSSTSFQTENQEVEVLPSTRKMDDPFEGYKDGSAVDGIGQHSSDLGGSFTPHYANPEKKMDNAVRLAYTGDNDQMEGVPGTSISAVPLFSVEDNKVPINNDCGDDPVNKSSDMVVLSPTVEKKQTDNLEGSGCHKDTGVIPAQPAADLPTCVVDNSKQVIEENLDYKQADPTETKQDMCVTKELDKDLSIVAGTAEAGNVSMLKNDQRIQSLDVSEEVKANNMAGTAENGASAAPNDLTESKQMEPEVIGLSSSDDNPNESANGIAPDADFRTEVDNISKFEATVTDDANRTSHTENSPVSPQPMEKFFEVTSSKSACIAANNSVDSDQSQADLGHDGSLKESNNSELVSVKDHDLTSKTEGPGEKEAVQASEVEKASCGSPTIITSSEPSQREKGNQEQARGSEVTEKFQREKGNQEQARGSEVTEKFVNDIQPSSEDPKRDDTVGDDTSFTFKVTALPGTTEGESGKCWSPFPVVEKCNTSVGVEEITPTGEGKTARKAANKTPPQSARVSEGEHVHGTSKGTSERKGRRSSAKGMAKENAKGNQAKRTNSDIPSGKGDKVSNSLLSASSTSSTRVQLGQIERSDTKVSGAASNPTSTLPDLNASALSNNSCAPALFQQFFTDSQQVQLRAQIFVYGSLIQGTAPDEACMVSAFGPSDGGRTTWEPVWRAAVERVRNQKPNPSAVETPLHSKSGPRSSDTAVKQSPHSSKLLPSPVSHSSNKGTPAAVLNPIIPLSSPLWSISTPFRDSLPSSGAHKGTVVDCQHASTPVHSYQIPPPMRNFVGHASWPSQACFPGPWIATPRTSTFNSTVCFQPVTMTETVKLSPVKEPAGPLVSGVKHLTSSPTVQTVGPSPVYVGVSPLSDPKPVSSTEKHSVEKKPRKRKKIPASDPCQVSLVSETRIEPVVVANVTTILSSPVAVPVSPSSLSDAVLSRSPVDASAGCSNNRFEHRDLETQKAVSCSKETLTEVDEAKFQAEDAAALAAAAVKHSEDLWSQLAKQKDSGLTLEAEAKLASAAGAIAAAASVTKAAAAAAKIAYNVALQAKLMADEAFLPSKTSLIPSDGKFSGDQCDVGNATPAFKCDNVTSPSSSILVAAKEAAKKRIEAASAASKQAENLDAIMKAAELAATAVSQAGTIVAMGEPLPLSDLIKAGPEGYWKLAQPSCELAEKSMDKNKDGTDVSAKISREVSVEKGGLKALAHRKIRTRQRSNDASDGNLGVVDGSGESGNNAERDFRNDKGFEISDSAKSSAVTTESDAAPRTGSLQNEHENVGGLHKDSIKEGSLVEVFKHGDSVKSAWYSANVLQLEDGKAFVCYSELLPEKGSENLCEWVPIEGKGNKAPIIRTAHPLTALESQGTRKRRRAALGDYAWCIGDRVDVWINDGWWEGVVTEKNEKDETTLKVHFPAQEETLTVRAWNLRTSRLWADGKWVEWSSLGGHNASEQCDTPQEKRQKMGSPTVPPKGKDKLANDVDYAPEAPEESKLPLSTRDRVFDIGKTTKEDNKRATRKPLRTGQQKEESRVIFGVPKPTGKKRKFMEVSKHFSANRAGKSNETNESVKFAKYLMPQTATTRGWKAPGRSEPKERQTLATRSRALSTRRPARTLLKMDDLKSVIAQGGDSVTSHGNDIEDSVAHDVNASAEATLSSLLTTSKKVSSLNTKTERLNKGKLVPARVKMSKIEEEKVLGDDSGKSALEVTEPRRSNRRFQPTHRLLEGLQSSMIIPKMSSAGHDKGVRNQNKNVSTKGK